MNQIPIVTQEEFELARKIEEKMLALPKESGVLFVGVSVEVTHLQDEGPGESPVRSVVYHIALGIDRSFTLGIVEPLVRVTVGSLATGINLVVEAHRGRVRKTA